MQIFLGESMLETNSVPTLQLLILIKKWGTKGLDGFSIGFLDGPKRVIVIIHRESSDRLLPTSFRIVDMMRVQTMLQRYLTNN